MYVHLQYWISPAETTVISSQRSNRNNFNEMYVVPRNGIQETECKYTPEDTKYIARAPRTALEVRDP